uniref:Ground-like domain-containing protein n=1 Tax=Plectus sambesii TaxID=2011161 RepID=A0A914WX23_9BILA
MHTFFTLTFLLCAAQIASSTFWPFVPGPNPFAPQAPAAQYPNYQQSQPQAPWNGRKRRQAVVETDLMEVLNPTCKSEKLRTLMLENMSSSTQESTSAIQHATKEMGEFDVVCAKGDLSLSISSTLYCRVKVQDVACYAFSSEI